MKTGIKYCLFVFFTFITLPGKSTSTFSIVLRIDNIYFKYGIISYEEFNEPSSNLYKLAHLIKDHPGIIIEIQGHQDPSEKAFNLLSCERAKKVAEELVSRGANRNNIIISFFNWSVPVKPGDLPSVRNREKEKVAKQMSQRVEFDIDIPEDYSYTNEAKQLKIEQRDP